MLKRFLPLLFVIFATLAVVFLFLVFRGGDEAADGPPAGGRLPETPGVPVVAADGVPEFRVASEADYLRALEALGTSPEDIEAWARSRGFPPATFTAAAGVRLERPYRRYEEDRLRPLAEAGDRWAMQFLAAKLARSRPLEAAHWYREAALRGSVYAAGELGDLYGDMGRALAQDRTPEWEKAETNAVKAMAREEGPLDAAALAWVLAAETEAALPPGALSRARASYTGESAGVKQACERAARILADLAAERERRGLAAVARQPPPFSVQLPPEETSGYCEGDTLPPPDWAGCETVRLVSPTGSVTAYRCRSAG